LVLIENAMDVSELDAICDACNFDQKVDATRIGYVGRLVVGKRVNHIIEVFNRLWLSNKQLRLVLIGDGPDRDLLEQQANALPSADSIEFTGYIENRFLHMGGLSLFIMASVSEGIPRSVMEAMAMRIPVAAYSIPGVQELITHEETGMLAPSGDIAELESVCSQILNNPELGAQLGSAARLKIETRFSAIRLARDYSELYKNLKEK